MYNKDWPVALGLLNSELTPGALVVIAGDLRYMVAYERWFIRGSSDSPSLAFALSVDERYRATDSSHGAFLVRRPPKYEKSLQTPMYRMIWAGPLSEALNAFNVFGRALQSKMHYNVMRNQIEHYCKRS